MTLARPSLRQRVLRHVLLPLSVTWLAGTGVALGTAQLFAQRAFDRSLLDDAYLLATHVRLQDGGVQLNLTQGELSTVLFDQAETMFFSVRNPAGGWVAGHPGLRMVPADPDTGYRFDDVAFLGRRLRAVTLHRETPAAFDVTVAQTTSARQALLQQLLLYSLLPQLLLLTALAGWLRHIIALDARPLSQLEQAVQDRDADDLAPVAVQATTHDVAALADAINSLLARLKRSVGAQREFSGNVAHELRTPLAGIRALADYGLAQTDPRLWREQLVAIAASEQRASALVDKLLALAVAQEAATRLELVAVRLDVLVRDAILRFLPRADTGGVDLGAHGADVPVLVRGDATLLEGILNNLLDNALRYGSPGVDGTPATVTVGIAQQGPDVELTVQDNGLGIPGEQQAQLMARGAQGETGQLLGQGAGLGLALVAQYSGLMKARMTLGGGVGVGGQGWTCTIVLPAA